MSSAVRNPFRTALPAAALCAAIATACHVPVAEASDDSASRARKGDVDARARIRCAQELGQAFDTCDAAVARDPNGDAAVIVRFGNGFARTLYFEGRTFVSANATMSGNGTDTSHRREGDLHLVRVDDQRYELPVAFVSGD